MHFRFSDFTSTCMFIAGTKFKFPTVAKFVKYWEAIFENICWDDRKHAMFIDFDRSAEKTKSCYTCVGGKYGDSLMCPTKLIGHQRMLIMGRLLP